MKEETKKQGRSTASKSNETSKRRTSTKGCSEKEMHAQPKRGSSQGNKMEK